MHIVSAILRRNLLQHDPIAVEGVGTLHTVRYGARFLPGQRLEPPRRMPELVTPEPDDLPLAELVAADLEIDLAAADGLCGEWFDEALRSAAEEGLPAGSLRFEGIGTVRYDEARRPGGLFIADPELLEMRNPLPAEPLVVPTAARQLGGGRPSGHGRQPRRGPRGPRGKNPHRYTVSFLAVVIAAAALGYVTYYLWTHTDLFAGLLSR